jgi:hypothetical protein
MNLCAWCGAECKGKYCNGSHRSHGIARDHPRPDRKSPKEYHRYVESLPTAKLRLRRNALNRKQDK